MSLDFSLLFKPGPWAYGLAAFLVCLLAIAAVMAYRGRCRASRLFPRFNALWNQQREPFCPRCRAPLTNFQQRMSWKFENTGRRTTRTPISYRAFQCQKCSKQVRLVDEDGFELTLDQARQKLFDPPQEVS